MKPICLQIMRWVVFGFLLLSGLARASATGTASPLTVTGLTNGTAYTFTAYAINAIGTSPASTIAFNSLGASPTSAASM